MGKATGNICGIGMGLDEKSWIAPASAMPDYKGMNFNNLQHRFNNLAADNSPDMGWEKSNGVFHDPSGKFKDLDMDKVHVVDLKNDRSGGIGLSEKDNHHDC